MKWARVFVIILCFSTEIRVRAASMNDFNVESKKGLIEIDKNDDGSLDVQTFKNSSVKILFKNFKISLTENSFVTLNENASFLHFGKVFVAVEKANQITLNTRHAVIKGQEEAQFVVSSKEGKTKLSTLFGQASIASRLNVNSVFVRSGYQMWVGGLLSSGKRAQSKLDALDYPAISEILKRHGFVANTELNLELDHLHIAWKRAVDEVAVQTQDQIKGDMVILEEWLAENRKRDIASEKSKSKQLQMFRAHALDLPDKNAEAPLE